MSLGPFCYILLLCYDSIKELVEISGCIAQPYNT